MWQSLHDAWWRLATQSHPRSFSDALACRVLLAGSVPYRAVVAARNRAYDWGLAPVVRLPCPVVSVGNVTVGGTGKTACVELIAQKLSARGERVAVLSRGYGGRSSPYTLRWEAGGLNITGTDAPLRPAVGGTSQQQGFADEPQLLARHLPGVPVLVGRRRDRTGRTAQAAGATVLVLDDGFQHRRLARDCDVVLIHARTPFDGWALLPRGPMREPLSSLRRAHVIIVTKADEALSTLGALTERLRSLNPRAAIVTAVHEPVALCDAATGAVSPTTGLSGRRVGLVSSIGDPAGFEATVQRLHATVAWHRTFPDHHAYRAADWDALLAQARQGAVEAVLTTEKDWVRLQPVAARGSACPVPLQIVLVRMAVLAGEAELDDRLARVHTR